MWVWEFKATLLINAISIHCYGIVGAHRKTSKRNWVTISTACIAVSGAGWDCTTASLSTLLWTCLGVMDWLWCSMGTVVNHFWICQLHIPTPWSVGNGQRPLTCWILPPEVDTHERPPVKSNSVYKVFWSEWKNGGCCLLRRSKGNLYISSASMSMKKNRISVFTHDTGKVAGWVVSVLVLDRNGCNHHHMFKKS